MEELTRQELLALIGEQQVLIAQLHKTLAKLRKEAERWQNSPTTKAK
jgi:hypothetical protein